MVTLTERRRYTILQPGDKSSKTPFVRSRCKAIRIWAYHHWRWFHRRQRDNHTQVRALASYWV